MRTRFPVQQERIEIDPAIQQEAYEVYAHCHGKQDSLLRVGDCRGGFGTIELIAYLRARQFPREEWRQRVEEAFSLMNRVKLRYGP